MSKIAWPLCRLLQKEVPFKFNKECKKAFKMLKELLTTASTIQTPNWSVPFELMYDANPVRAVLEQWLGNISHAIYYASRTLNDAQLNNSTTEKVLLAVIFALEKFCSHLIGTKVTVFFYHATL